MNAPPDEGVAVVLGGTSAHAVLIGKLKARGYRTVLVDHLAQTPASGVADLHLRESTLDADAVEAVARAQGADLVIATSVDQANVVACEVSERLGLPHPYPPETGREIADKGRLKARLIALGLPTARHVTLRDPGEAAEAAEAVARGGLRFPVIVKPTDSNGSKGVLRCDEADELRDGVARAVAVSRTGGAIVEDFVEGTEFNVYAVVADGRPTLVTACRKYNHDSTDRTAITSYATWYQNALPSGLREALEDILARLAAGFGLRDTALILQVILRGEAISILEFAPRVGGGLSYWAVDLQTGCDLIEVMLDAWLGRSTAVPAPDPSRVVITMHLYARPCTFARIEGVEALRRDGVVADYIPNKMEGAAISAERASRDRVGSFVLEGRDAADVLARARRVIGTVAVRDAQGRDVTDRDTFIRAV